MRIYRPHPATTGRRIFGILILFLLSIGLANAQPQLRTGRVTDDNGNPLGGVSVTVRGQKNGTSTDDKGNYSIQVQGNVRLIFSFVGYTTQELTADAAVNVVLKPS